MVAGLADEPGNQRNRPARGDRLGVDDGGQGHPTLTPNVSRPVRLSAMVEVEADIRRLLRVLPQFRCRSMNDAARMPILAGSALFSVTCPASTLTVIAGPVWLDG